MAYDIAVHPYSPVATHDGDTAHLSLPETLLRAPELRGLACTVPTVESGLLRVLAVLAARVTGLDRETDPAAWQRARTEVLRAGRFDATAVRDYFAHYAGRFDLFATERPWLQDPRLAHQQEKPSGINALVPGRPTGNTLVWHSHTWSGHAPPLPAAQAGLWLLHHHFHGSGGAGGFRTVHDGLANQYMAAPPLRSALSYYPAAADLFSTLIAAIPSPAAAPPSEHNDAAPWEREDLPDPAGMPPLPTWPAGLVLAAHQRHAQLLTGDAAGEYAVDYRLTWAFQQRAGEFADPYTIREPRGAGRWSAREASVDRAVWRDVDALLAETAEHARPPVLTAAATLPRNLRQTVRVRALGADQDRQAKDYAFVTSETPPLLRWLEDADPHTAEGAAALHTAAEKVAATMGKKLRLAYARLTVDTNKPGNTTSPWERQALAAFWPPAERLFWQRLHASTFTEPHRGFTALAHTAVDEVTGPMQHRMPVAREIAAVHRALVREASKAEPRRTSGKGA